MAKWIYRWAMNFRRPRIFWCWILARLAEKRKPRWAYRDISRGIHRVAGSVLQQHQNSALPERDRSGALFQDGDYQSRAVPSCVARNREAERHDSGLASADHCRANPRGHRCFATLAAMHISTAANCEG